MGSHRRGGGICMIFDGVLNVAILLLILVGLVLVHELGHFVMARRAGVTVHEFGIGFPPRAAVLYRGKETVYTLNWLPIGGFVRLEGEEGESVDPHAFVNQKLGTRLRILVAGVVVNFVLAWVIFAGIALFSDPVSTIAVGPVQAGSPAQTAGFVGAQRIFIPPLGPFAYDDSGDVILAMNGEVFPVFDSIDGGTDPAEFVPPPLDYLASQAGETVVFDVRHADGSEEQLTATLRAGVEAEEDGALGIAIIGLPQDDSSNGVVDSIVIGFERTVSASTLILRGVAELVGSLVNDGFGGEPPVAGPLGIASVVGSVRAELPPVFMVWLVGLLSANLAIINILPFPPMDGGRVTMALLQALSGNRVSPAAERMVYLTGFVMLMALLVWVTAVDVGRLTG